MSTENIDSLIERRLKEFESIGEGRVRFIATRQEVRNFLISSLKEGRDLGRAEVLEEVREKIKKLDKPYSRQENDDRYDSIRDLFSNVGYERAIKDLLKAIEELK